MKVQIGDATLYCGDCVEVLRLLPDGSIDSVVTDPPYGLSFMGKRWDYDVPSEEVWRECLRVLKPGGHLLAFAGTRTQHRMAVRIEDAGFEIRDMIAWVYGSGFPKSLDVSKAITAVELNGSSSMQSLRKARLGKDYQPTNQDDPNGDTFLKKKLGWTPDGDRVPTQLTDAAKQWQGWGTALKPALEPITVARKPLVGTVAENVLAWGTGGLSIDGCRVEANGEKVPFFVNSGGMKFNPGGPTPKNAVGGFTSAGRWPANLIHDGSEEAAEPLGSAARFFYAPKASKADRDEGCEGLEERVASVGNTDAAGRDGSNPNNYVGDSQRRRVEAGLPATLPRRNHHPTVKPTDLMRYLCRLVTPPGGVVLDPFTGSGSTGKAALLEGFRFVGIEREAEYVEIARARIAAAVPVQGALL